VCRGGGREEAHQRRTPDYSWNASFFRQWELLSTVTILEYHKYYLPIGHNDRVPNLNNHYKADLVDLLTRLFTSAYLVLACACGWSSALVNPWVYRKASPQFFTKGLTGGGLSQCTTTSSYFLPYSRYLLTLSWPVFGQASLGSSQNCQPNSNPVVCAENATHGAPLRTAKKV